MGYLFQSTLPLRGATERFAAGGRRVQISIHAPLAGSDCVVVSLDDKDENFNPRSPCGERRNNAGGLTPNKAFQSTLPLRGATEQLEIQDKHYRHFNPRSPCGERRIT